MTEQSEQKIRQAIDTDLYHEWEEVSSEWRRSMSDMDAAYLAGYGDGLCRAQDIVEKGHR